MDYSNIRADLLFPITLTNNQNFIFMEELQIREKVFLNIIHS